MAVVSFKRSLFSSNPDKYVSFLAGNAAYNPSSFDSIATATGTGSSGTITFSSIPSTYKHLQIRVMARSSASQLTEDFNLRINGDTGSNYYSHYLFGNGSSAGAGANGGSGTNSIFVGLTMANTSPANEHTVSVIDIHDYSSTTKNKTIRSIAGSDANNVTTGYLWLGSGLYSSTSAVNSVSLLLTLGSTGNFTTTSTIALYGIKG